MNHAGPTDVHSPISVVVASKVGEPFIGMCLDSLRDEVELLGAEVVVVAHGKAGYAAGLRARYPWIRVVESGDVSQVPAMRRIGVEAASGELIAVIEEHCSAHADWLSTAVAALDGNDYAAVGGPVVDYDYARIRDWVVYFLEYNGSMPPAPDAETADLNDANIVYRREILTRHIALLDDGYWPMHLHPALVAEGVRMRSVPGMLVHHRGPFDFGYYLGQRFLFSRAFAGVRARSQPLWRRLAYLLAAPLIPALLLGRMTLRVWQKRCRIGKFVQCIPLLIPALLVMVVGEWLGILLGPGDALARVE
jgi:hypothetical protein